MKQLLFLTLTTCIATQFSTHALFHSHAKIYAQQPGTQIATVRLMHNYEQRMKMLDDNEKVATGLSIFGLLTTGYAVYYAMHFGAEKYTHTSYRVNDWSPTRGVIKTEYIQSKVPDTGTKALLVSLQLIPAIATGWSLFKLHKTLLAKATMPYSDDANRVKMSEIQN